MNNICAYTIVSTYDCVPINLLYEREWILYNIVLLDDKIRYLDKNLQEHTTKNLLHNPLSRNSLPNRYTIFEHFITISENIGFQLKSLKIIQTSSLALVTKN